jgi:GH15 family glucan-1,4-alpha-glucosidase
MPRPLVLGNGTLLAAFDASLQLRDFYFPHVGMEDHTTYGNMHRLGVFVQGKGFSWLCDGSWTIHIAYKPETLVTQSTAEHTGFGIRLVAEDCVHPVHNILLRRFLLRSIDGTEKNVTLFFHHNFFLYGDKQKDTAFYEPHTNSVIHYRQQRYILVGGSSNRAPACTTERHSGTYDSILHSLEHVGRSGITSFTTGKANFHGLEGTWRDAEDGILSGNPIEQGSVDSTVGIESIVLSNEDTEVSLWVCAGTSLEDVVKLHQVVMEEGQERLQRNCHNYWKSWVNKTRHTFDGISGDSVDLFKRSLLIMRIHADRNGGIVAAADSDIMAFNRDTYTYVWPRDGALVSLALDEAGYSEVTRHFFRFCCDVQTADGYLLHKYNPDGSLGSSWHPWHRENEAQLPIQEDETALVIYAMWKHFEHMQDFEFLQTMFEKFVKKAARFLCEFREAETGLPLPSYDLWEEQRGIFTYTTACTIAGLSAAAHIAHILGHYKHSERYATAADEMRQALLFHLYNEESGRFYKAIRRKDGETIERVTTPDASIAMIWKLGVLPPDDPRVVATMQQLISALSVHSPIGGIARYENDHYQAGVVLSKDIPGNPWIITTLWCAEWHIDRAKTLEELIPAQEIITWATRAATGTGILPEQLHPTTGAHLSVAPLTWSHAAYVETVLKYLAKRTELQSTKAV